jgi:hypothetical protein
MKTLSLTQRCQRHHWDNSAVIGDLKGTSAKKEKIRRQLKKTFLGVCEPDVKMSLYRRTIG